MFFIVSTVKVWAVAPADYFNSLVAGGDEAGNRDGSFVSARFNNPIGLCSNEDGDKIFVADSGNHRIRTVDLENSNNVSTLAGTGQPGQDDGTLDKASFNLPTRVTKLPGDRLAVYDAGSGLIRIIDLKTKTVSTAAKGVTLWDMVYRPQDDSLYFSEPESQTLARLDLKTSLVSNVFVKNVQVPAPRALCVNGGDFYVADSVLPAIYMLDITDVKNSDQKVLSFKQTGQADNVLEMAFSGKSLYALQAGNHLLTKVDFPKSTSMSLGTPWGFLIDGTHPETGSILNFEPNVAVGFLPVPKETSQFFISKPSQDDHRIVNISEYAYAQFWKAATAKDTGCVMDYAFPAEKPKNTYRILLAGDSRTFIAPRVLKGSPYDGIVWFYSAPRTDTMAKQLERYLNTEAALRGVKTHYEVLEWNREGLSLSTYAYTELTPLVEKYKVDLVLALVGNFGYIDYYMCPITKEGVPMGMNDYEFILKPLSQRVPPGAAEDFYQRWKKKNPQNTEKTSWPGSGMDFNVDPEMHKDMIEMTGRRLDLLAKKIKAMGDGKNYDPKVVLFHVPFRIWPNDPVVSYWKEVGDTFHLPLLDLSDSYNALKFGYYPTATECCDGHYTYYGSKLIGRLLSHYLVEDHLIPFETDAK